MPKPMRKKIGARVRKGARSIEKSISDMRPNRGPSATKVAGVAGAAVASAAGVAAAVRMIRRGTRNGITLHVRRNGEHEWIVAADGSEEPLGTFGTKREAVKAGRTRAQDTAPSGLVIHRSDGSVQESHSYEAA